MFFFSKTVVLVGYEELKTLKTAPYERPLLKFLFCFEKSYMAGILRKFKFKKGERGSSSSDEPANLRTRSKRNLRDTPGFGHVEGQLRSYNKV